MSPLNKEYDRYKAYISAFDSAMAGINRDFNAVPDEQKGEEEFRKNWMPVSALLSMKRKHCRRSSYRKIHLLSLVS
ncbi:hypothetical protein MKQ70_23335 [Chitinophaga sedimenti]|uniref:hypothetical protein n=1 Tax=Chitinophaga sedimenti TaxID=2033606 RepID=UPI00200327C8|nr:hypothetical protein [Chitinophaga sedimenti]MCK7557780.1 hypothetical protein [Chitinophaga sedimenti]